MPALAREVVQIAPSKGMTLPFISYGGSSMLALSISMGLLLAFTRRNPYLTRSPYVVKWSGEPAKLQPKPKMQPRPKMQPKMQPKP